MPDLAKLWIARNEEHISGDAVHQHLFACDSVIAQCEKDPGNIRVNLSIINTAQRVEQIHYTFFQQNIDTLSGESEVYESKRAESLDADLEPGIHAKVHDHIDNVVVDQLCKQCFMIS